MKRFRHVHLAGWGILVLALTPALFKVDRTAGANDADYTGRPATLPTMRSELPAEEPVLQLWLDGVYLLKTKPSPRFILWADGTVLQRLPNEILYRGQLSQKEMGEFLQAIRKTGLFNTPISESHVRPDGGSLTIAARDGDKRIRLSYDGLYDGPDALAQIGPFASPSRQQVETFLRRWHHTLNLINAVAPERLQRVNEPLTLGYPTTQPAK